MSAFWCNYVPCVGAVRALYMFPQPLAIVYGGFNASLGNASCSVM